MLKPSLPEVSRANTFNSEESSYNHFHIIIIAIFQCIRFTSRGQLCNAKQPQLLKQQRNPHVCACVAMQVGGIAFIKGLHF